MIHVTERGRLFLGDFLGLVERSLIFLLSALLLNCFLCWDHWKILFKQFILLVFWRFSGALNAKKPLTPIKFPSKLSRFQIMMSKRAFKIWTQKSDFLVWDKKLGKIWRVGVTTRVLYMVEFQAESNSSHKDDGQNLSKLNLRHESRHEACMSPVSPICRVGELLSSSESVSNTLPKL